MNSGARQSVSFMRNFMCFAFLSTIVASNVRAQRDDQDNETPIITTVKPSGIANDTFGKAFHLWISMNSTSFNFRPSRY